MSAGRVATVVAAIILVLASGVAAQTPDADLSEAAPFGKPVEDQRIFVHGLLDQLEGRIGDASGFRWDGQAWIGTDTNRLRLRSEAAVESSGTVSDGLHEILYDRPITTYFDAQAGIRLDLDSGPSRVWGALGIQGLAPQFFELDVTGYVRDSGHFAARLNASYDLLLTQRLILQPEIELNVYSKTDLAPEVSGRGWRTWTRACAFATRSSARWRRTSASCTRRSSATPRRSPAGGAKAPATCASSSACGRGSDRHRIGPSGE